jgi:hypothetical protein
MAMLFFDFELRPVPLCRLTKLAGRPMLGFNALSDGAALLTFDGAALLPDGSLGWPDKRLRGPDVHLLTFFDDLASVLAIQVRPQPVPELLGPGSALEVLSRYESLVAASDDELDDPPEEVLAAGDHLVARSVYLPGDTRLLVLDRGEAIELACEGQGFAVQRQQFLETIRLGLEGFFLAMQGRVDLVAPLAGRQGYLPPAELARQGAQWQRRIEALMRRAGGEKFAPLQWPW